jgi:choline dehydrogenase-like flavoprotein
MSDERAEFDLVVVGSGFGGTMFAAPWVEAGKRVLLLERGDWVPRDPRCWDADASFDLTPYYSTLPPYRVLAGCKQPLIGSCACVGGASVFYGGVSLRLRHEDLVVDPEIVVDSGAAWPLDYETLEPFYAEAERRLDVAGTRGVDPTEPPRSGDYPQPSYPLTRAARLVQRGAERCGLRPFPLPLAINYRAEGERRACAACRTCDTFACAIGAKNDLASGLLPTLLGQGLTLRTGALVTRLQSEGRRVTEVELFDRATQRHSTVRAGTVALAAGAIGSPHLLLASRLEQLNPGGQVVGRYLMRHCNGIVFGVFPRVPDPERQFHKQLGVHDFYFGHPTVREPKGKLGSLQQLQTPPIGLVRAHIPPLLGAIASPVIERMTGLLLIAEDQPQPDNQVRLDWQTRDSAGLPQLEITHRYSPRDLAARRALGKAARRIMRQAGAWLTHTRTIQTFSHALGTVRMGTDPERSALDAHCRFRGVDNLFVVDASAFPTAAAVNPSLTIAANALRASRHALEDGHGLP